MKDPFAASFPELSAEEIRLLERDLLDAARRAGLTGLRIASAERAALGSTSYRTEVVTVRLDSDEHLKCFVKNFSSFIQDKGQMAARRDRERFFYKELFRNGELGLPAFVADVWSNERTWLVLEFVEGVPLSWCELDVWYEAAAWLGRFQTAVAERLPALRRSGHFIERGPQHFSNVARAARASAGRVGEETARHVAAAVPAYLAGSEELIRQPQMVVHGAFKPSQILVNKEAGERICPIDWEIAAIGSCLYDLAALAEGFEGARLETFLARYSSEAAWLDEPPDVSDLRGAIETRRIHRTLKWIAQGEKRGFSPGNVRELAASLAEPVKELQP